jgi:hypothetical protein
METKNWWESKTIIGATVAVFSAFLPKLVPAIDDNTILTGVTLLFSLGGFVMTLVGRFTAKKDLT